MRFVKTGFRLAISDSTGLVHPKISNQFLLRQFWLDIFGKEVQSAATYSYLWLADQVGHLFIGLFLNFIFTLAFSWLPKIWSELIGLLLAFSAASIWEIKAYLADVRQITGRFPLDEKLLRRNAITAAGYMWMGAVIGLGLHQALLWGVVLVLATLCVAVFCAGWWLRQKIIWQKAALPYLFRLADAKPTISEADAKVLQAFIEAGVPPTVSPRQVVIGGPIGSGRTSLATGIGTEFAFSNAKVRYLSFDTLLEFAVATDTNPPPPPRYSNDPGPRNISYWPWNEAQVLVIDDIGPLISSQRYTPHFDHFDAILNTELGHIKTELSRAHTIWICGDLGGRNSKITGNNLNKFAAAVAKLCGNPGKRVVIELQP